MKARKIDFSKEYLNECFEYIQETGVLVWKPRPSKHFKAGWYAANFIKRFSGKEAGYKKRQHANGYRAAITLIIDGVKCIPAHRIIWTMFNGPIPDGMLIDHINGDPWDNRLENLRTVTRSQNNQNAISRSDNKFRCRGISFIKRDSLYMAQLYCNGKLVLKKTFKSLDDAISARINAEMVHYGEFARSRP